MHVSDHSRVASLLFFYRVIRSGFIASYCGRTEILQARVALCCPFNLRPSRHVICSDGVLVNAPRKGGFLRTRPNEMANLDNGFAATRARMLENALND